MSRELIGARVTKGFKRRIDEAARRTGQTSSDFIKVALAEFFTKYPNPESQLEAVIRWRANEGRAS